MRENFFDRSFFPYLYLDSRGIPTPIDSIVHKFVFPTGSDKKVLKTIQDMCLFYTLSQKLTIAFRYYNRDELRMGYHIEAQGFDSGVRQL